MRSQSPGGALVSPRENPFIRTKKTYFLLRKVSLFLYLNLWYSVLKCTKEFLYNVNCILGYIKAMQLLVAGFQSVLGRVQPSEIL